MGEEKTYSVKDNHEQSELRFDVVCGKRPVVKAFYTMAEAQALANALNKEITPMIEALDEKNLKIMNLIERNAELEAFVKRVAEHKVLDIFSAEYADSWDTIAVADHVFFVDFVEEAKKLTGETSE